MLQVGVFGDEAALNLASNVLSVDIAVITAFRESSIHQGFGITVIKALERPKRGPLFLFLFNESDFFTPHYQSVRPITEDNVLATFLAASDERTVSTINTTSTLSQGSVLEITEENFSAIPVVDEESLQNWPGLELTEETFGAEVLVVTER